METSAVGNLFWLEVMKNIGPFQLSFTRSGNERLVKHANHSKFIARGTEGQPRLDLEMLSDIWLAWGFQMNFMYEPVH